MSLTYRNSPILRITARPKAHNLPSSWRQRERTLRALARSGYSEITCRIAVDSRLSVAITETITIHRRFPLLDLAIRFQHSNIDRGWPNRVETSTRKKVLDVWIAKILLLN
ncbi:uncharacterized protein BT62DRAFT_1080352 [Guyanagaster necrorhizus]|uniref:Uncharacterized protein n=1 Tax=Guyanagaster necrorhizus TaxID=856835 RepID=A0A9P7VII8_9AGAR|nr:uncharacterized protein BT62DRAFT_1080352 [Guyanagaster necrorhizus MCA 3950]KAG7441162.1 hypothetical protein BT62DRAFT_1080352 [Guyanagaster necrorhizus MCA 3950]